MTGGFQNLRVRMQQDQLPPWHERLPLAFWRGSTTGTKDIDLNNWSSTVVINLLDSVGPGPVASMPASTELCNAAMRLRANKLSNASIGKNYELHRAPLACRTTRLAN